MKTNIKALESINLKNGYGRFPYLIMRINSAIYMQIPIHFIKQGEEHDILTHPGIHISGVLVETLQLNKREQIKLLHHVMVEQTNKIIIKIEADKRCVPRLCLVEGPDSAYYFEDGKVEFNRAIPSGGTLIDSNKEFLSMNTAHYLNSES